MAATLVRVPDGDNVAGRKYFKLYDLKLDASYPNATGYVINAADVGLKWIQQVDVVGANRSGGAYTVICDLANTAGDNVKSVAIRLFVSGAELANATDVHLAQYRLGFVGF